ncbi:unnamed protein product [Caenorhabditis sp. 36 PRJEB53466]|nr:unnamed protein product [Caenorhabditis sp. 36 PRJEB53466]
MIPLNNSTPNQNSQMKVQTEFSPQKMQDDGVSKTPLLKKLFRRKLSACHQQMIIGKYRPKATPTNIAEFIESDDKTGASAAKKKRMIEPESFGGVETSERGDERENVTPQGKMVARKIW